MVAKSADEARAQASARAAKQAAEKKAAEAKAAADRAAAAKAAAAKKAAADKAAAAKAATAKQLAADKKAAAQKKKDDAYYSNFLNPITSAYDPRIIEGGRIDSAGNVVKFNPEMTGMTANPSGSSTSGGGGGGGGGGGNGAGGGGGNPADNPVYAALLASLSVYNISGLSDTLLAIRTAYPDITSDDMLSLLRYDKRYNAGYLQRFSGNAKLVANGKIPLDEKTYLANEAAYAKIFKAYDVTRFANTAKYAELIGNELAPDEVGQRVSMAYNRLINADTFVLGALNKFGNFLSMGDIVAAMLDPKNEIPALNNKITSAEIGGAALRQGLQAFEATTSIKSERYSNVTDGTIGTEAARRAGADAKSATVDYQTIAKELPTMEFLSSISKGLPQYAQKEAEEANILGLASAERKKQDLIALERSRFSGSSGNIGSKSFRTNTQNII